MKYFQIKMERILVLDIEGNEKLTLIGRLPTGAGTAVVLGRLLWWMGCVRAVFTLY